MPNAIGNLFNNNFMEAYNKQLDDYLKQRRRGLNDIEESEKGILAMGATLVSIGSDGIPELSSSMKLIDRYQDTLESWEWKAIYNDGTELDQYGEIDSDFGDIDQSKLDKLMFISNFEIDTINLEKRMTITLNVNDGTFEFLNCGPMEIRAKLSVPVTEPKKLILFKTVRDSFTAGVDPDSKRFEPTGEKVLYRRYYLGYETPIKAEVGQHYKKVLVCAYPNGEVTVE
jgi:hypothetical protein